MFRVAAGTEMTPELLAEYMTKHKTEINDRYQRLHDAYENKYKISSLVKKPDWKPDNRIPVNFAKYITDTMNGFFIGIPIKTTSDDETVSEYLEFLDQYNDQDDNNAELSKVCSIYGNGYEMYYVDEQGKQERQCLQTLWDLQGMVSAGWRKSCLELVTQRKQSVHHLQRAESF